MLNKRDMSALENIEKVCTSSSLTNRSVISGNTQIQNLAEHCYYNLIFLLQRKRNERKGHEEGKIKGRKTLHEALEMGAPRIERGTFRLHFSLLLSQLSYAPLFNG
jgi:hypothetical protein